MRVEDQTVRLEGDLTLEQATRLLAEGNAAIGSGAAAFDLAGVGRVDSSALSLMLSWRRRAASEGRTVTFQHVPDSLHSLAKLYGIGELIA
ncbi:MAG: STAS domain-containing protein [Thiobacillaceae bacterium]|jgi:phospholipid transport system transporter-binding protein|nr:STAS domain-containing protein [Thiobacillaceae bacterium]